MKPKHIYLSLKKAVCFTEILYLTSRGQFICLFHSDFEMYVFALSPKDCWGRNFRGNFCCGIYRACVGDIEFGKRRV